MEGKERERLEGKDRERLEAAAGLFWDHTGGHLS